MKNMIFIFLLTGLAFFYCDSKVSRDTKDGVLYINNPKDGLWQDRKDDPIKFELEMTFGVENEQIGRASCRERV